MEPLCSVFTPEYQAALKGGTLALEGEQAALELLMLCEIGPAQTAKPTWACSFVTLWSWVSYKITVERWALEMRKRCR